MNLKQSIIEYSQQIGIDAIGFTDVSPFYELEVMLKKRLDNDHSSGLTKGSIEEKVHPKLIMPNAKSIISIGLAYPRQTDTQPTFDANHPHVLFARSSWGIDYHELMNEKLNLLSQFIKNEVNDVEILPMVDTGLLNDRAVALRAGIGFSGKNSSVIHETYGSYLYLGELLLSCEFKPDTRIECLCGDCRKCLTACPTGAIFEEGGLNEKICLSYITQSKEIMDETLLKKVNKYVYGCDICQEVCPFNKEVNTHHHEKMEPTGVEFPQITELLKMTQKEFKSKYGHLAGSWRGVSVIKRNAILNARFLKYKGALPEIKKIIDGQGPEWLKQSALISYQELSKLDEK